MNITLFAANTGANPASPLGRPKIGKVGGSRRLARFVIAAAFASAAQAQWIGTAAAGPPGAPTLEAPTVGGSSLTLNWTAPADNGGAAITGYKVRWANALSSRHYINAGQSAGMDVPGGATAVTHTIPGLTDGITYQVQIAAVNTDGSGEWSAVQSAKINNLKAVICLGAQAVTSLDACVTASKSGYGLDESTSGAQNIVVTAFFSTPSTAAGTFELTATQDAGNPLVADMDTDGALPAFAGARIPISAASQSASSATYRITPKASGNGGRINIDFTILGGDSKFQSLTDDQKLGAFLQIANTGDAAITELGALTVDGFPLTPALASGVYTYDLPLPEHVANFTLRYAPAISNSNTQLLTRNLDTESGSALRSRIITPESGDTKIRIQVLRDGIGKQTPGDVFQLDGHTPFDPANVRQYIIQVDRAKSSFKKLSSMAVRNGVLMPVFSSDTTSYSVTVPHRFRGEVLATQQITANIDTARAPRTKGITFIPGDMSVLGISDGEAIYSFIMGAGMSTRTVRVIAQDDSHRDYTVVFTRMPDLMGLALSAGALTPAFANTARTYTATVDPAVASIRITPRLGDGASATVRLVGGDPAAGVAAGAQSAALPLAGGGNVIEVAVTQNNFTATYQITVTRPLPDVLTGLSVSPANNRLRLKWTAPSSGALPTDYRVRWAQGAGSSVWINTGGEAGVSTGGSLNTFYDITNLTNGTVYPVQAAAANAAGTGAWTASLEGTPDDVLAFASQQEDLTFARGKELTAPLIQLPEAEQGATPYTYEVTGLFSAGVNFDGDPAQRTLSGTPSEVSILPDIPITYKVTDANSNSDMQTFTIHLVTFDLDLDTADDAAEAAATAQDGIITARYLLGVRGAALLRGQASGDAGAFQAVLKTGVDSKALDVDGNGNVNGDDGILIARFLLGLRDANLVAGIGGLGDNDADAIEEKIYDLLPKAME